MRLLQRLDDFSAQFQSKAQNLSYTLVDRLPDDARQHGLSVLHQIQLYKEYRNNVCFDQQADDKQRLIDFGAHPGLQAMPARKTDWRDKAIPVLAKLII